MTPLDALGYALDRLDNPQPAYCKRCYIWDPRRHMCGDNRDWARCREEDDREAERRRQEDEVRM